MSPHNSRVSTTRRGFLAAGGTAAVAAVAGCTAISNFIMNRFLGQVNVLNQYDEKVDGTVEVVDPAGDTVLDESYKLAAKGEAGDERDSNFAAYDDVWTEAGSYEVSIELTNVEIDGVSQASETVSVEDTGSEMLGVALGAEDSDPISFDVGDDLSEFDPSND
jgi:hypothetical protein